MDFTAVFLYDAVGDAQAESGTAGCLLGGEERIEYPFCLFIAHACAVVFDDDFHVVAKPFGEDFHDVARLRGLYGVGDEIHKYLFYFGGIDQHTRQIRGYLKPHVHACNVGCPFCHVAGAADDCPDVFEPFLRNLVAGKLQNAFYDPPAAQGAGLNVLQRGLNNLVAAGLFAGQEGGVGANPDYSSRRRAVAFL